MFKANLCKFHGSAFVATHTLENLVLLNHMRKRLNIELTDSDATFLVGIGPNPTDFTASYLKMPEEVLKHGDQEKFVFANLVVSVQNRRVEASLLLPSGEVLRYAAPRHAITASNVQDGVCMVKKHCDSFAFNYLSGVNKYKNASDWFTLDGDYKSESSLAPPRKSRRKSAVSQSGS